MDLTPTEHNCKTLFPSAIPEIPTPVLIDASTSIYLVGGGGGGGACGTLSTGCMLTGP